MNQNAEIKNRALRMAATTSLLATVTFGFLTAGVDYLLGYGTEHVLFEFLTTLAVVLAAGGVLFVFLTRIYQRQALTDELIRSSDDRFRHAINSFPYGVTIYAPDLKVRYVNNFARRLYDREVDSIVGMHDASLLPAADFKQFLPELHHVIESGQRRSIECEFKRGSNTITNLFTFAPTFKADGTLREIISVQVDMTAFKAMSQRVRRIDRSMATLLSVNRALAFHATESELLLSFCTALVNSGNFRSAVIGRELNTGIFCPTEAAWGWVSSVNQRSYRTEDWPEETLQHCSAFVTRRESINECECGTGEFLDWERQQPQSAEAANICVPVSVGEQVQYVLRLVCSPQLTVDDSDLETMKDLAQGIGFALQAVRDSASLKAERVKLGERIKEMSCLADLLRHLSATAVPTSAHWQFVADRIPAAFMNPDQTFARLEIDNGVFESPGCRETGSRIDIEIGQSPIHGRIAVFVDSRDEEAFLPEEIQLLEAITDILHETIEHHAARAREMRTATRFEQTFEQTAVGIAHVSPEGRFVRLNRRFSEIAGWPPDELAQMAFDDITHPDDLQADRNLLAETIAGQRSSYSMEKRYLAKDGRLIWINLTASLVRTADGAPDYFVGVIQDITVQKQAAAAIEESEARFRSVVETSPDGIIIADLEGTFLSANPTSIGIYGYTEAELLKMTVFDLDETARNDGIQVTRQMWRELYNHGRPQTLNGVHICKDGRRFPAEIRVSPMVYQSQPAIMGMIRDISARIAAEEQLRLHESALQATTNSIVITDKDAKIVWVNPAFTRASGYTLEEAVGQNPRILQSGQQSQQFYQKLWDTLAAGETWQGRFVNCHKDGHLYQENAIITPVPGANGEITHYVAIKQDITEQVALEEQFRRAQRMESVGLLAGGIAHDLNNVLAPILMAVDLLRLGPPPEELDELLDSLETSINRGAGIIRQVLTFARGSSGEHAPLQLRHILKEVVKIAQETFPRDISIEANLAGNLHMVAGDPTQIHQVLLNLAVNARDAMPQGGVLRFEARNEVAETERSFLNLTIPAGTYVLFSLSDTGTGMTAETMEQIFEPFFTTKEQGKGTGLGLSTVIGIIRSHHGLIEVVSQPGEGTTFTLRLPALSTIATNAESAAQAPPAQGRGEWVLIVDDETEIVRMTTRALERNGYQVETARDGASAVAVFAAGRERYAAVITDVMMPFMDGVALTRSIKKISPETPVIVVSGMMDEDVTKSRAGELHELGVKTILQKPFAIRDLLEALSEQVRR